MSLKAIRWAFQRHMNDATAKAVLVALAEHIEDGRSDCWPGAKRVGEYTALSERTVRAALVRLADMSAIRVEERAGQTPLITLNFDWSGQSEPRRATPRSRKVGAASNSGGGRKLTAATPEDGARTPASDADEPYEPLMNHKRGAVEFSEVPEAEQGDDDIAGWPAEDHDGAAVLTRPPSDRRGGGARTTGDHLARFLRQTGPPEKRLKPQDRADQDMVRHLTTRGGMDTARAWAMVMAARDEDDPHHTEAARELEKISRKHTLGFFVEERA